MSKPKSEKGKRKIVRTSSDSEDFNSPTTRRSQSMKLKGMSKGSQLSDSALDLKSQEILNQCSNLSGIQQYREKT